MLEFDICASCNRMCIDPIRITVMERPVSVCFDCLSDAAERSGGEVRTETGSVVVKSHAKTYVV